MTFRIATFNLHQGFKRWEERRELIVAQLAALKPDIIALNEISVPLGTGRWLWKETQERYSLRYSLLQQTKSDTPSLDEARPVSEYFPKWERAVLKYGWQHHRADFPPQFKSFTQFMKWLTSPEGKQWNRKQGKWRNKVLNGFVTLFSRGKI